ncbi:MAG: hypothetical protein IIB53_13810 [Planctomycetes bacterium]|nr:hypothetical protein [Planctomycetota bacterium]
MKLITPMSCVLVSCVCAYFCLASCVDQTSLENGNVNTTRPTIKAETDADTDTDADTEKDPTFPSGQISPEGVACDMARAFINADKTLWLKINNPTLTKPNTEANDFVENISKQMEEMARIDIKDRPGPKEILRVYKARHLSMNGPASYGYAVFNFEDVMFVDVVTLNFDGTEFLNRTLVVKDRSKWYVVPRPDLVSLLSWGLNSESESIDLFENK